MVSEWYCQVEGKTYGPMKPQDLQHLARSGCLKPTDRVRKSEAGKWVAAAAVKGLVFPPAAQPEAAAQPAPANEALAQALPPQPTAPAEPIAGAGKAPVVRQQLKAVAELRAAARGFAGPVGNARALLGCLSILLILGGLGGSIYVASVAGFACLLGPVLVVACLGVLVYFSNRHEQGVGERAREEVERIEADYGLSREESFGLLCGDKEAKEVEALREFARAAWGDLVKDRLDEALTAGKKEQQRAEADKAGQPVEAAHFVCNECDGIVPVTHVGGSVLCPHCQVWLYVPATTPCPGCKSANTLYDAGSDFSWTGAIVGGLIAGPAGAAVGGVLGKRRGGYRCNDCSKTWALRLKKGNLGPADANKKRNG